MITKIFLQLTNIKFRKKSFFEGWEKIMALIMWLWHKLMMQFLWLVCMFFNKLFLFLLQCLFCAYTTTSFVFPQTSMWKKFSSLKRRIWLCTEILSWWESNIIWKVALVFLKWGGGRERYNSSASCDWLKKSALVIEIPQQLLLCSIKAPNNF